MLVLIAVLLVLIPTIAILYPFLRRPDSWPVVADESSHHADLLRRWDVAIAGLKNAELERALGNLAEQDHSWLREQYMTEAALVIKAMELEEQQEQEMLSSVDDEIRSVRRRLLGGDLEEQDGHSDE